LESSAVDVPEEFEKKNVRPNVAKSFPKFSQILLIFFKKKKIYCEFHVRAQKKW
jgi:hypothetical protein